MPPDDRPATVRLVHRDGGGLPRADDLLSVTIDRLERAIVVIVDGEVDALTVSKLRLAVDRALAEAEGRAIVVDLTEVTFLGTKGLKALVDAHNAAQPGTPLRLVVDHTRPVIRPLQLTGLDRVLALFDYRDEALAADAPDVPG
jgi:anti-sigma B factor antagonist